MKMNEMMDKRINTKQRIIIQRISKLNICHMLKGVENEWKRMRVPELQGGNQGGGGGNNGDGGGDESGGNNGDG